MNPGASHTSRRVFLIGTAPLPGENPREMGFPNLRTAQVLTSLLREGHQVCLAAVVSQGGGASGKPPEDEVEVQVGDRLRTYRRRTVFMDEPGKFLALRDYRRDWAPHVTVTAGPFLPMAAGARAAGDEPLWVDVPGDPMAEAQARSFRAGSDEPVHRYRQMLSFALARGDQFSVISPSQRGLLIGALGLSGRLTGASVGHELVQVMPACVEGLLEEEGDPSPLPSIPDGAFVLLFCGGYNTWLDADTLLRGVLEAMDRDGTLHFLSTGGPLQGHEESTWQVVRDGAERSRHRSRFHFVGWVPASRLASFYRSSHLGLCVDIPCYEAEFGTRTRILDALQRGLPVLSTVSCDLTRELLSVSEFHAVPESQPQALAERVLELAAAFRKDRRIPSSAGQRPWEEVSPRYSLAETTAPLLRWVQNPERAPSGIPVDFLGDQWAELARLQDRLEEVWKSPTWRYLGRVHALVKRWRE